MTNISKESIELHEDILISSARIIDLLYVLESEVSMNFTQHIEVPNVNI